MIDLNLATQELVSGLYRRLERVEGQSSAMAATEVPAASAQVTQAVEVSATAFRSLLAGHALKLGLSDSHPGITAQASDYLDDNGDLVGSSVLKIDFDGQTLYVPASESPSGGS